MADDAPIEPEPLPQGDDADSAYEEQLSVSLLSSVPSQGLVACSDRGELLNE